MEDGPLHTALFQHSSRWAPSEAFSLLLPVRPSQTRADNLCREGWPSPPEPEPLDQPWRAGCYLGIASLGAVAEVGLEAQGPRPVHPVWLLACQWSWEMWLESHRPPVWPSYSPRPGPKD